MDFDQEAVIKRIKEIQSSKLMNQKEFAQIIHVKQSDLSTYLSGKKAFGMTLINRIVLVLSINKTWLLTGKGEMQQPNTDELNDINVYKRLIEHLEKRILDKEEVISALKDKIVLLESSNKKTNVPQEGNAMNADAAGFSEQ